MLQTRKRQVAQIGVTIEPADDSAEAEADAELAREFFDRDDIDDELFDVLDSIGKGFSVTEIVWDMSERQWMPERLEWRLPQWFDFDREGGRYLVRRPDQGASGWSSSRGSTSRTRPAPRAVCRSAAVWRASARGRGFSRTSR